MVLAWQHHPSGDLPNYVQYTTVVTHGVEILDPPERVEDEAQQRG